MPWRVESVMDARNRFIDAYLRGESTMTALCAEHGISRDNGYKWVRRYDAEGRKGLADRSRVPLSFPHATDEQTVELVVQTRKEFPNWGPRKLKIYLERLHKRRHFPAASTIGRILSERGLSSPQAREKKTPPYGAPLQDYARPNRIWCADFKGSMKLRHDHQCTPLTISDGYSRYLLRCVGMKKMGFGDVKPHFESAFSEFGMPDIIRTDNGPPFASRAPGGLSKLSIWWIKLGIAPERITPGRPTQNGRHERIHRTLNLETGHLPRVDFATQQRRFDRFMHVYNDLRPHESLGGLCPKDVYKKSSRRYPCPLNEPVYGPNYEVRKVISGGEINWKGAKVFISESLETQELGIRWHEQERLWLVEFGDVLVGRLNQEGRFKRSDTTKKPEA